MLEQPIFPRHASPSSIAPSCFPLSPLLIYPISQPLLLPPPSSCLPIHLNHCQTFGLGEDPSKAKTQHLTAETSQSMSLVGHQKPHNG